MLGIGLGIASAAMRRSVAPAAFFAATGGTTGTSGSYTRHTFTASGTFQITSGSATVFWEIVGGGGERSHCRRAYHREQTASADLPDRLRFAGL